MHYLTLHYWSKFQKNLMLFGGVMVKKLPGSSQKLYYLLQPKHLKAYNLTTTNGIMMKLSTIMYLYETFHLANYWDITHSA